MASLLEVGKVFRGEEVAKAAVDDFGKTNFVDFVVDTNNKLCLKYVCKHGARFRPRCSGERPKQHYNALECSAVISFYKSPKLNGGTKCTRLEDIHNHPVSQLIYGADCRPYPVNRGGNEHVFKSQARKLQA